MTIGLGARIGPLYAFKRVRPVHGMFAPVVAIFQMIVFMVVLSWWLLKLTAILLYLGGRACVSGVQAIQRRYPRVPAGSGD